MFEFLQLLKKPTNAPIKDFNPMGIEYWICVVRKSKKGAHLNFSNRNYAMHEVAFSNEKITNLLVAHCNTIITVQFFPERWLKILVVII